jgi:hypothetical protein
MVYFLIDGVTNCRNSLYYVSVFHSYFYFLLSCWIVMNLKLLTFLKYVLPMKLERSVIGVVTRSVMISI